MTVVNFPLVSPIPISTSSAHAGSAIVCLVPGSTPAYDPDAKVITIAMTVSNPSLFALSTFSPITVIAYKGGVCTVTGPPAFVLATMLEGIKFTYDLHRDISKEKIAVVIHDGAATATQLLTFAPHTSVIGASIAAAKQTTFNIGIASPFPSITLTDPVGGGKSLAAVTIIPEVPSAIHAIGTSSASGASVHINAISLAGRAFVENLLSAKGAVSVSDRNVLSICFKGTVAQVNAALVAAYFIAPQAVGSNTVLNFGIVVSDDTSTIMSQRVTLHGVQVAAAPKPVIAAAPKPLIAAVPKPLIAAAPKSADDGGYPIYGTTNTSVLPPAPVNGVPYTIQIINGTPTWVLTKQAAATILPVNVASPNAPTTAIVTPFNSTVSSDVSSADSLRTVAAMTSTTPAPAPAASSGSAFDLIMTIIILLVCLVLFGGMGWLIYKDWNHEPALTSFASA